MSNNINEKNDNWTILVPISNLELTKKIKNEIKIDKVTFIASKKIPYINKKLGSNIKLKDVLKKLFKLQRDEISKYKTFAILRLAGTPSDIKERSLSIIRDELAILSVSQLGYSNRNNKKSPSISKESPNASSSSFMLSDDNWINYNKILSNRGPLVLDEVWYSFNKKVFFYNLLKIFRDKNCVKDKWKKNIKNAVVLAGQSQSSKDIPQSFLWNMISLETLITSQNEKQSEKLVERIGALISWQEDWENLEFDSKIKDVYKLRCNFVHDGKREKIKMEHVHFTDILLLNVLTNILYNLDYFTSKKKFIEFSEILKAENFLGIKHKKILKKRKFLMPKTTYN